MSTPDMSQLPEYVRKHELATISVKNEKDEYQNEVIPAERLDEAEVVTSKAPEQGDGWFGESMHRPVIDIDMAMNIIPSTTPGHGHLYIDKLLTWHQYERLLNVLRDCGIVEPGYAGASIARGFTAVRLPWVKKKAPEVQA